MLYLTLTEDSRMQIIQSLVDFKTDDNLERAKIAYMVHKLFAHDFTCCYEVDDCNQSLYKQVSADHPYQEGPAKERYV